MDHLIKSASNRLAANALIQRMKKVHGESVGRRDLHVTDNFTFRSNIKSDSSTLFFNTGNDAV